VIYYCLKQNQNKQFPQAYLKWYAKPVQGETYDLQGQADHMSNHHTIYSPSVILGAYLKRSAPDKDGVSATDSTGGGGSSSEDEDDEVLKNVLGCVPAKKGIHL
jgi:hypothetical protein